MGSAGDAGMDVEQFAHLLADGIIEIHQELPVVLGEKRAQVVFVIFEKGRLAVG